MEMYFYIHFTSLCEIYKNRVHLEMHLQISLYLYVFF